MQGDGEGWGERKEQGRQGMELHSRGHTHTHTEARTRGVSLCPHVAAAGTSGKDQASVRHFSPSRHEASATRGWAKVTGLCREEVGEGSACSKRDQWGPHDKGERDKRWAKGGPREKLRHKDNGMP